MRSVILTFCLLAVPLVAAGQAPGDTVTVVIPSDKNCSDFRSEFAVQQLFGFGLIATGGDVFGLDANADGQPCEGQEWGKVEQVGDGYLIRYKLVPWEVECPTVEEPFTIAEYKDVAQTAVRDSVGYLAGGGVGIWNAMDCLHSLGVLRQAQ